MIYWHQSQKGAIVAPERHYLPNCKQASLLTKTSWHSGRSTSAGRVVARDQLSRREKARTLYTQKTEQLGPGRGKSQPSTGGDYVCQGPGHLSCLDLAWAQNAGPTKSAPLWTNREPEPEWLTPGKCMQTRACIRQFPGEQPKVSAV